MKDWVILVFTGVLALAAVVQVVVMLVQARYMLKGLKGTRLAAAAAKQSANAAAQTANTLRTTERAIVLIENVEATMSTPAHGLEYPSVVIFTLKNFGRIIAESVKLTGALTGVGNLPIKELPPTTIAPQGNNSWVTQSIGNFANDDVIRKINERKARLEYKIVVTYGDSFGRYKYQCEGCYEPTLKRFLVTASTTDYGSLSK